MGGIGSGSYPRLGSQARRPVADKQVLRLDVRELHKAGLLFDEARGSVIWHRGGADAASIGTRFLPCEPALRLDYEVGPHQVPMCETVKLTFTACHFGGDRPWFRCPLCNCRCAVLWGRGRFLCRTCQRVSYPSQNESIGSLAIRRVHEIRAALHAEPCLPIERIPRPRYMRYARFRALIFELLRHEAGRTIWIMGLVDGQSHELESGSHASNLLELQDLAA
jgi:hypothetical protein